MQTASEPAGPGCAQAVPGYALSSVSDEAPFPQTRELAPAGGNDTSLAAHHPLVPTGPGDHEIAFPFLGHGGKNEQQ